MASVEQFKDFEQFYNEFQGESDRACAILGAVILDERLRALLEALRLDAGI